MAWEHKELALNAYTSAEALEAFDELGLGGSGYRIVPLCYSTTILRNLREPFTKLMYDKQHYDMPYFLRYSSDIIVGSKHFMVFPLWALEKDIRTLDKYKIKFNIEKDLGYLTKEAVAAIDSITYFGRAKVEKVPKKMHLMNKVMVDDELVFMKYSWEK